MIRIICYCIVLLSSINVAQAQSSFGNLASNNKAGKFSLKFEGSKVTKVKTVMGESTLHTTIGNLPFDSSLGESTSKYEQETIGVGLGYSISDQLEIFGGLSDGNQTQEGDIRSDDFSAYKVGLRFVPVQTGLLKMGIMVQLEKVNSRYYDDYSIPNVTFSTTTDHYFIGGLLKGEEEVSLTNLDLHIGFSVDLGSIDPYFGLYASKINGDYNFSGTGTNRVTSIPVGGGSGTTSNEMVTMRMDGNLEEKDMFGVVVGVSMHTIENLGFDIEYQAGARNGIFFGANYTF